MAEWIRIKGARQNNLKNIDVAIPRGRLVVITGPSGAGKSSLAFETLYAEGHRRYVEALSPSARQFLTQLEKPDVDAVEGLSPAIAVQLRSAPAGPRSTVGTVSEIYDFLRLLYARVGTPHCWRCGRAIRAYTVQQIVDAALARPEADPAVRRVLVCAPVAYEPRLDWAEFLAGYRREGFVRVRIEGALHLIEEGPPPPRSDRPDGATPRVEIVVDRLSLRGADRPGADKPGADKPGADKQRLTEAVELALAQGNGVAVLVFPVEGGEAEETFSRTPRCPVCGITYPEPHPRIFSFNSPFGACEQCHGLGSQVSIDLGLVVPEPAKSLAQGAIAPWEHRSSPAFHQMLEQVAAHYGFSIFTPYEELAPEHREVLMHGSGERELEFVYEAEGSSHRYSKPFEGVVPHLERRFRETESDAVREDIRRYMTGKPCRACDGQRLRPESLNYRLGGRSIAVVCRLPLDGAQAWLAGLALPPFEGQVAAKPIEEIGARLGFLANVGLDYLTLDRTMDTLSTGEHQRVRLATQIGSALSGVIYILDEPTVGLHPRDTERLLDTLAGLRDAGNTVVVVEHDREAMLRADWLIEIGPQAGEEGGRLVAQGTPAELEADAASLTGAYLAGRKTIAPPAVRRGPTWARLALRGATGHNLKGVDVEIPLGLLVCVTGVSGSGKSSLILDTLHPALSQQLTHRPQTALPHAELTGAHLLDRVVHVDQSPIGKSARSNPGTYLGVFGLVREQFAALPEARARGYAARRFSFNVAGGRCEVCQGEGYKRIEMHFLPDVFVHCDVCGGSRYNRETLEMRYRGKSIADVLAMTATEVEQFFRAIPAIRQRLAPLLDMGLGYLRLGQPANTLSGGEAQRLKIARQLARREGGRTLYLLDEPTTGLHVGDVERLLAVLNQLVQAGNSVVVIEHNLELIKCADHVIELGPEGGAAGGRLIAQGTPEELVGARPPTPTARYLRSYLERRPAGASHPGTARKERSLHAHRS